MRIDQDFLLHMLTSCERKRDGCINQDEICKCKHSAWTAGLTMDFETYKSVSNEAVRYLEKGYFRWAGNHKGEFQITIKGVWALTKLRHGIDIDD